MSFPENLRRLLDENKVTQKQLAGMINVAASTVGNYIQGKTEPDLKTLVAIANALGTSVDSLLGKEPLKLSANEEIVVQLYRRTDTEYKDMFLTVAKSIANHKK